MQFLKLWAEHFIVLLITFVIVCVVAGAWFGPILALVEQDLAPLGFLWGLVYAMAFVAFYAAADES